MIEAARYLIAFLVVLGVLITFHELGHYLAARWCGVRVMTFSIGFGRPLWQRKMGKDATQWAVALFPLGGYVRMLDEREAPVEAHELHRAFNRQSVGRRSLIVAAGPLANFVLAIILYWIVFITGHPELLPILGAPPAESPAFAASIQNGDRVESINGEPVASWGDFRWRLLRLLEQQSSAELVVTDAQHIRRIRLLSTGSGQEPDWDRDPLSDLGVVFYQPPIPPRVGTLVPDGAGLRAGLHPGDLIVAIGGTAIKTWSEFVLFIKKSPGTQLILSIERDGYLMELPLVPDTVKQQGGDFGRVGVGVAQEDGDIPRLDVMARYPIDQAFGMAVRETWEKSWFSLRMLGRMLIGSVSWKNISGPVTIADYAGRSAKSGASYYLQFMALVSISLGILNLLPVPMLDGGHLMYHTLEVVRGRPLSERALERAQRVGLFILLSLMAFALFNDANRLIFG